ncbi:MAG: hypothetical protein ABSG76_10855 [Xanthobacteraceae bacterium]|jgi:hypothetical protein
MSMLFRLVIAVSVLGVATAGAATGKRKLVDKAVAPRVAGIAYGFQAEPQKIPPLRYYGGPKSAMWRAPPQ